MSFLSFVELIEIFIVAFLLTCQKSVKVINSSTFNAKYDLEKQKEKQYNLGFNFMKY
jgi:hypothetical protein